MNIIQYPHFLYVKSTGGASTQDAEGNWITYTPSWVFHSVCREETNGSGRQVNGSDGKAVVYSSMVYLPKGVASVPDNVEILVVTTQDPEALIRVKGTCLKCDITTLHGRIWV